MQRLTENLQKFISDRQGVVLLGALSRADASLRSSDSFVLICICTKSRAFLEKHLYQGVFFLPAI